MFETAALRKEKERARELETPLHSPTEILSIDGEQMSGIGQGFAGPISARQAAFKLRQGLKHSQSRMEIETMLMEGLRRLSRHAHKVAFAQSSQGFPQ